MALVLLEVISQTHKAATDADHRLVIFLDLDEHAYRANQVKAFLIDDRCDRNKDILLLDELFDDIVAIIAHLIENLLVLVQQILVLLVEHLLDIFVELVLDLITVSLGLVVCQLLHLGLMAARH